MITDLAGRTAVVTGAASGIGFALARRFGSEGANVVRADVEDAALAEAEARLAGDGIVSLAVRTDVRDPAQVDALADAAESRFGPLHLVCNNAGVVTSGRVAETTLEQWRWVLDVNLWGVVHGCRTFAPRLAAHGQPAHIVNTASMAGLDAGPYMASYFVSKFGVVALSEALWHEQRLDGTAVGVSVLCPGFVRTRITQPDRNRPDGVDGRVVDGPGDVGRAFAGMLSAGVETGKDPAEVADAVRAAVRDDRFWVLTHPESSHATVAHRAACIIEGSTPNMRRQASLTR
jgi:NAD(P)-dependent dehydrogenase (short-subunit alcohol dehydrogenase family)